MHVMRNTCVSERFVQDRQKEWGVCVFCRVLMCGDREILIQCMSMGNCLSATNGVAPVQEKQNIKVRRCICCYGATDKEKKFFVSVLCFVE